MAISSRIASESVITSWLFAIAYDAALEMQLAMAQTREFKQIVHHLDGLVS